MMVVWYNIAIASLLGNVGQEVINIKQQDKITALLCRLSREDELVGDSESIQTQKKMLYQYAKEHHFTNIVYYVDDGYSGTTFDRPEFQRLKNDIEKGKVGVVIVKDLSRLGRDHIMTGYYLEHFFPEYKVRFIAINDDVDSEKGINDFTPFKNIMNEWYAKDISKKIRSAYKIKAMNGEFTGAYAPYGYKKNPDNKHQLIINEETAHVVKRIFQMACEGLTAYQICRVLKDEKILKPRAQIMNDNGRYYNPLWEEHPYDWSTMTIYAMIKNEEYLGHLVCNKASTSSYKSKKLLPVDKDKWIIKKNTHEAIIDEETFKRANEIFYRIKKRPKKDGKRSMFSGLLRCDVCGKALSLYSSDKKWDSFCCVTYRSFGKSYCSAHYIRYENLYDFVLNDIRKQIKLALSDKEAFIKSIMINTNQNEQKSKFFYEKEIKKHEVRLNELQKIEKRLYEDMALERITPEMFANLTKDYEEEKKNLKKRIEELSNAINLNKDTEKQVQHFIELIEKYKNIKELDAKILNELINKIVVYEREIINGVRTQKIEIEYNFVNKIKNGS